MMLKCSLVLLVVFYYSVAGQDPNCTLLTVRANLTLAQPGNGLRYCRTNDLQCCTDQYFQYKAMDLRDVSLIDGLRRQISTGNGDVLENINEGLRSYITTTFIPIFVRILEFRISNMTQNLTLYNEELMNYFYIRPLQDNETKFTVQGFTESLILAQINLIIHAFIEPYVDHNNATPPLNNHQHSCVQSYLREQVNQTTKSVIDGSVQELRLAVTAVDRIHMWFHGTFLPNISAYFKPFNACIDAFIDQTCQECVENIHGLCHGVCNAIAYGCYAVVHEGLRGQFNVLWNVTNQLVNISRGAVHNVSTLLPNHLLRVDLTDTSVIIAMAVQIAGICNFTLRPPSLTRNRRDIFTDDDDDDYRIPEYIIQNATSLEGKGLFDYGNEGSYFCRAYTNNNCWNGTATVETFTPKFLDATISGQINNPFLNVNLTDLQRQVASLGTPVTTYLVNNASFQDVAPQGLVLPEDTPTSPSDSAGTKLIVSSLILLMTVLLAFLF